MVIDSKGKELNIGDSVLYINEQPKAFSLRGTIVGFTPICVAHGEMQYMVDVCIKFVDKNPASGSTVRIWSGQLTKYDAERTVFV